MKEKELHEALEKIAQENLIGVETLDQRNNDSQDFHEVSVWSLEKALKEAYELGLKQGKKEEIK